MKKVEIKHFKVLQLPISCEPNAIYYVLDSLNNKVKTFISDSSGIPIPLIDLTGMGIVQSVTGTGVSGTINNPEVNITDFISSELGNLVKLSSQDEKLKVNKITSPDLSLEIVNTSNELQIEIANNLLEKINNALQPEDISQYTDEQSQDAVGNILTDTATIDLTYSDTTPSISASVRVNSITISELSIGVNNSLSLANTAVQPINIQNFFNKLLDNTDSIIEGATKKFTTTAEKNKISNITITQPVNLDQLESDTALNNSKITNATHTGEVTGATALTITNNAVTNEKLTNVPSKTYKGRTSASTGIVEDVPTATLKTDLLLNKSDVELSNVVNADTTTTANITDFTDKRFVTDAEKTKLINISGTNTGDETLSSLQSKRPLKTIEGQSLEGSGNIDLTKSDVGLANVDNTTDLLKPISTAMQTALNAKQNTLVSGTNIRTVNGNSLLGSTDLVIASGTGTVTSVTGANGVTIATGTTTPVIGLGAITPISIVATGAVSGSNLSGTNTGDNATNTQYSGLVTNATHSGDATGATVLTLATVNANVGSFGSASSVPQYTVNAKGLTTASSNVPIQIAQSQVTSLSADLASKVTTVGTTGNLQRIVGTNQLGNSALVDNGTSVTSSLPFLSTGSITGNSFVKAATATSNILLAGGTDITQASLPISTATQTALDLKANLASPALTGAPTAPTPTTTTGIANKGYVDSQSIPQLEFNATDLTVWNNGKGNVVSNTSFGDSALRVNSTGFNNTAIGNRSLILNTTGTANTSVGNNALQTNSTGQSNTSFGASSLGLLSSGSENTSIGGSSGNSTGLTNINNSVFIGFTALPLDNSQTNQIVIGHNATGAGSNTATLGNTSITSTILRGTVTTNGSFINSTAPAANVLLAGGGTLAQTGLPYLPLTGGALTGALNGTSAVFSSSVTANVGNLQGITVSSSNSGFLEVGKVGGSRWRFSNDFSGDFLEVIYGASGATPSSSLFKINPSGAATFSSSVTASLLKPTVYTVATLPTPPSTGTGTYATVSDAVAPAYLTPVMGGGAVVTPVFYNGSNWICH